VTATSTPGRWTEREARQGRGAPRDRVAQPSFCKDSTSVDSICP